MRSDDPLLRRQVEELIEADDIFVWPALGLRRRWPCEIERVFDSLGLLRAGVAVAA